MLTKLKDENEVTLWKQLVNVNTCLNGLFDVYLNLNEHSKYPKRSRMFKKETCEILVKYQI